MRDADAEPQRPHASRVGEFVLNRLGHERCARGIPAIEVIQFRHVVAAARPGDVRQVGVVGQAEVVERERFPETQLDSNASIKPIKDALAVCAFRRRGEAQ